MKKKVLFLSYFFPPVGGAGVQRAAKFVKYLPEFGWQPTVLTVENPSVPLFDHSLEREIPDGIEICKAKTLEPGYAVKNAVSASTGGENSGFSLKKTVRRLVRNTANFVLQPDPQILWMPAAYKEGLKILRRESFDAIIATGPPFSSLILGARLSRKTGVPLLLDYRDEWDISNSVWENKKLGRTSLEIQKKMQRYAVRNASALVATTQMSTDALGEIAGKAGCKPEMAAIYNGYDPEDFKKSETFNQENKKYQLSYVGTLWNLTSIEPLVKAIQLVNERHPDLAEKLELVVAGRKTDEQQNILSGIKSTRATLTLHDYLDHTDAVSLMEKSDGLLLLLSGLDVAGRVVPAKIFEYFACHKNIHAIAPRGEVWNLLKDYPGARCTEPQEIELIAEKLVDDLRAFSAGNRTHSIQFDSSRYDRKNLTGELAELLDRISGKNSVPSGNEEENKEKTEAVLFHQ